MPDLVPTNKVTGDQLTAEEWNLAAQYINEMWTDDVKHSGNGLLRDHEGNIINPRTTTSYVFNPNTTTLESRLVNIENSIVQSDWNETNTSSKAYIRNKPTIPTVSVQDVTVGGTSVLSNGVAVVPAIPDISGKADKVNTPQIYEIPAGETLPLEIGDNCKPGDIFNRNTISQNNNHIVGIINTKYTLGGYEWIILFSSPSENSFDRGIIDYTVYRKNNNQWELYTYKRYSLYNFDKKTSIATSQPQSGMLPNTLYNLGELTNTTTFTLHSATDNTIANVWMWTFSTGSTPPTINWPTAITMWSTGTMPVIGANKYYEINVMNGLAKITSADLP